MPELACSASRSAAWHLTCSTPAFLLDYFNPRIAFPRQTNRLTARFRAVHALCESGGAPVDLLALRDALAFHLVKMSCWWDFAFCPRAATGVRNPDFLGHVKAHAARSPEDEAFFDLLTWQAHTRPGDRDQVLVLGHDSESPQDAPLYFGLDAGREFRFSLPTDKIGAVHLEWARPGYRDFAGAWLAGRTCHAREMLDSESLRQRLLSEREHSWARLWHQRHFCRPGDALAVKAYVEACAQASSCRTMFGRMEFAHIAGRLAHEITAASRRTGMSVEALFTEAGAPELAETAAPMVQLQAATYASECLDEECDG